MTKMEIKNEQELLALNEGELADYIYQLFCSERQANPIDGITETHHILPRSCGGDDSKENLVELTPQEHFAVHFALPEIMKARGNDEGRKDMLKAHNMMSNFEKVKGEYTDIIQASEKYAELKREAWEAQTSPEVQALLREHPDWNRNNAWNARLRARRATDPEYRDRRNAQRRARRATDPEHRDKVNAQQRASRKKRMQDPEYRDKKKAQDKASLKKRMQDPEYRDKLKVQKMASQKKMMQDPEYRDKVNARHRERRATDPEYRDRRNAQQRASRKKRMQDPEYRDRRNAQLRASYKKRMQDQECRDKINAQQRARRAKKKLQAKPVQMEFDFG